jgi:hypothetical protein
MRTYDADKDRELILSGGLPNGATVAGYLDLYEETPCKSLPEGLKVDGSMCLNGCTFQSLPKGLNVYGNISIFDWTTLNGLPEDLKVGGHLFLRGCKSLNTLPKDLKVNGDLYLRGRTFLKLPQGVPEGVKGVIYADKAFFKYNKDYLLMMINCRWGDERTKQEYMKVLSED